MFGGRVLQTMNSINTLSPSSFSFLSTCFLSKLLGFEELQGSHTGANIAVRIVEVLDQYDIRNKVSVMLVLSEHQLIDIFTSLVGQQLTT